MAVALPLAVLLNPRSHPWLLWPDLGAASHELYGETSHGQSSMRGREGRSTAEEGAVQHAARR